MADWGIKVTLPGKDVTSTDARDFSMHSEQFQNVLRMTDTFTGSLTVNSGVGTIDTITINHAVGYVPFFQVLAYWNENGTVSNTLNLTLASVSPVYLVSSWCDIDSNNLNLNLFKQLAAPSTTIFYTAFFGKDQLV